jgi:hypothetical protein
MSTPTLHPDRIVDLSPEASSLLDVLVEAGHLDEETLSMVNDQLLDQAAEGGQISLQSLRRVVALSLFDRESALDPEMRRTIELEWGLLLY